MYSQLWVLPQPLLHINNFNMLHKKIWYIFLTFFLNFPGKKKKNFHKVYYSVTSSKVQLTRFSVSMKTANKDAPKFHLSNIYIHTHLYIFISNYWKGFKVNFHDFSASGLNSPLYADISTSSFNSLPLNEVSASMFPRGWTLLFFTQF